MTSLTDRPSICVVGAGAIGGWIAARLAQAGERVTVLARGATLERIRERGIEFTSGGKTDDVRVQAHRDAADIGPQDVVVIATKAQAIPALAPSIKALMHERTVVLPAINGIPWWFFLPEGVPCSGLRLETVDPDGEVERAVALPHVVGLSVFASSASPAPGVVRHGSGQRFVLGEPGGGSSPRVQALAAIFSRAGFTAEVSESMRTDIWVKLLGNACFNPVSMLTLGHTDDMIDDPGLYQLFTRMMTEALAVGDRLGLKIASHPADRIAMSRKMGHIKSSMLQDLEAGRGVEIEAILGALLESARAADVSVPTLETVLALARGRARAMSF